MRKLLGSAAALLALAAQPAAADAVGDFYHGKTVQFLNAATPGGGYDTYARTMLPFLTRHIPGNPTLVVQNMPGAGGVVLGNYLYNIAPKDGLAIALLNNTVPFEPMYQNKQAKFDAAQLNWLGSPSQETALLTIWHTVPVSSIEEARTHPLVLGASGVNSTPAFYARVENAVLGTQIRLIAGYPGQTESLLAMEKGENDGYGSAFWSSLKATKPDWIRDKKIKFLVQFGAAPNPELKDVPFAPSITKSEADKQLAELASGQLAIGRPLVAPPGVPADRLAALEKAVLDTLKDPEFLAQCEKAHLECDSPVTGAETAALLKRLYGAPEPIVARLRKIYDAGSEK
jgi:tripartite-type tricarboxylate transporter receptor subunit TctC